MSTELATDEATKAQAAPRPTLADEEAARAQRWISRRRAFHQMFVVVALAVAVRLPLLKFPMGRAAGTAAYVGQRWLDGSVPYRDVWDYRAPGLYLMSGVIMRKLAPLGAAFEQGLVRLLLGRQGDVIRVTVGGAAPETCRAVMLVIGLATMLLVYRFVRRWCNRTEAVVAAGLCGFFGGAILVQGDCLEPGPPLTFLTTLAMLAALGWQGQRWAWLLVSGLAAGLAVCFEPLAAFYVVLLTLWVMGTNGGVASGVKRWVLRPLLVLIGAVIPVGCFAAYFWSRGALDDLWRDAVMFNVLYRWLPLARETEARHWQVIRSLSTEQAALWLFAVGWALHAFSQGFRRETRLVVLWSLTAVACAMACRQVEMAHFLQAVPPLAIGAALAVTNPSEPFLARGENGRVETRSLLLVVMTAGLASGFVYTEYRAFLREATRGRLSENRAAAQVAELIRDRTMRHHPIYVWEWYPQIYALADRPAAHRIFYNRPLNVRTLREKFFGPEVLDEIYWTLVRQPPPFFVTTEPYLLQDPDDPDEEKLLRNWFLFMREHYEPDMVKSELAKPFTVYVRSDRARLP
jgi:hypothetical protein